MNDLLEKLKLHKWYQNTDQSLKDDLFHLAKNGYEGFVSELAEFPDQVGDTEVLSLHSIAKAKFSLVCPVFNVRKGDKVFTYEFATWKMGSQSGAKGVVFLRQGNEVTHFVILRASRFALGGAPSYDCVGGFSAAGDFSINETLKREIEEEIGMVGKIETVDLGRLYPDAGMTNNHPAIMAAFAEYSPQSDAANKDPYEMSSSAAIFSISEWREVATKNDDGFFAIILLRAFARGLINLS